MPEKNRTVKMINLTNHAVKFIDRSNVRYQNVNPKIILTVRPYGILAVVQFGNDYLETVEFGECKIPVLRTVFTTVNGLLPEEEGVIYIVPKPVADLIGDGRKDLFFLSGLIRDNRGLILGGTHLARPGI